MVTPQLGLPRYTCPHCRALAQQSWSEVYRRAITASAVELFEPERRGAELMAGMPAATLGKLQVKSGPPTPVTIPSLRIGTCIACGASTIWFHGNLLFPSGSEALPPSPDLTGPALGDYEEAARVLPHSPRAAAALLRLSLEHLCQQLLEREDSINNMIADFVDLGVPAKVQQAMDVLRVTGNEAVHPGTMVQVDDLATALSLFGLINLIVDFLITQPKHVAQLYGTLPAAKIAGIEARDRKLDED